MLSRRILENHILFLKNLGNLGNQCTFSLEYYFLKISWKFAQISVDKKHRTDVGNRKFKCSK